MTEIQTTGTGTGGEQATNKAAIADQMRTTSDLLLDVVGRVAGASGPDRELDLRIYHAISPGLGCTWEKFSDGMVFEKNNWCHRYTASLDSALALLPSKTLWAVADMEDGPVARVVRPMAGGGYTGGYLEAAGRTAPLALTNAALQVLAAQALSRSA